MFCPLPLTLAARSVLPSVKLKAIPTLYRWADNGKGPADALVEDEAKVASQVAALIRGD